MYSSATIRVERAELPSIAATLCSYESLFGPYHPHTLCFMAQAARAYWHHGEVAQARALLERAVRDMGLHLGRGHDMRLQALETLGELLVQQRAYKEAKAVQREIVECRAERLGPNHPETAVVRSELAKMLLDAVDPAPEKEF